MECIPDRAVVLNEQFQLSRSKAKRRVLVSRGLDARKKIFDAYKKRLIKDKDTFMEAPPAI